MDSRSLIGRTLGKYKIVESLGRGGMAEVYRAYQESLDRYVAIKLMHSFLADEEDFLTRFQREAKAMASLNHRNIVSVYDFDVQDGIYYIVMRFVAGGTLKNRLETLANRQERLHLAQSVRIVLEIADALAYAHGRGMVHRDIKPGNIMLSEDGRAILTDFGIAKILTGPSFTATGAMIGTPAYMSPEQGLGQPGDERSDLYALGVLFFQMTTGRLPYDADTPLAVILKHVNDPVPPPVEFSTDMPPGIQDVIFKAMAKDPDDRYQSAREMSADLQAAARASNLVLASGLPYEYSHDTDATGAVVAATKAGTVGPTVVPPKETVVSPAEKTRVATADEVQLTEIAGPTPPVTKTRRRIGLFIGAGLIALMMLAAISVVAGIAIFNRTGDDTPTPDDASGSAEIEATATERPTVTPRGEELATADVGATAVAAIAATLTAVPTETPLPTPTETPEATSTPDVTATFLASCETQAEFLNSYTYRNVNSRSAPRGATFPMNWVVKNSGTCPWPAGFVLTYQEGEEFGQDGPVALDADLAPGEERVLTSSLVAPNRVGTYRSIWRLMDAEGNQVGPELIFEVLIYEPATATPPPPPTPEATPTSAVVADFSLNWSVGGCEYVDSDWRCQLFVTPGGGIGPFTLWVFDADQPAEYRGRGTFTHFAQSRRCFPWIHEVKLQDDGTGENISQNLFISPEDHFEGGCTTPG